MYIIAGKYKGRRIENVANRNTRPTKSIIKEAIFNILSHRMNQNNKSILDDAVVADIFSGSGALTLEAISRGARKVYAIDKDKKNIEYLNYNVSNIGEEIKLVSFCADINLIPKIPDLCDIVIMDAPYKTGLTSIALDCLLKKEWLSSKCLIIVEVAKKEQLKLNNKFKEIDTRIYGNSKIILFELQ